MSSFYRRECDPQEGDIGTHPKYGEVKLIGQIPVNGELYYGYWLARVIEDDYEIVIVNIEDLERIGWYGD